jgi:hemoglobin-like flavoprotein
MRPDQVALLRTTWAQVTPLGVAAAALFYERLFTLDPQLASLFAHTDMERQGKKLLQALSVVVATADRLHTLGPSLEELGRGHLRYGVEDRHYDTVGAALLTTLESALGKAFTPAVEEAWTLAYAGVATHMRTGAGREQQAA